MQRCCSGTARLLPILQQHVKRASAHEAAAAAAPAAPPPAAGTPPATAACPQAHAATAAAAMQHNGAASGLGSWTAIAFLAIAGTTAAAADSHKKARPSDAVGWLSSAELALAESYQEVLQDWERLAAQQPPGTELGASPLPPRVEAVAPAGLQVVVPLRPQCDVALITRTVAAELDALTAGATSSSSSQQVRTLGTSTTIQWELVTMPRQQQQPYVPPTQQRLTVQLFLPAAASQPSSSSSSSSGGHQAPHGKGPAGTPSPAAAEAGEGSSSGAAEEHQAQLVFYKTQAGFTPGELAMMSRLLRMGALSWAPSGSPWPSLDGPRSRRPHGEFWQHLEEQWRQELGALAPGLEGGRQLMEGLAGGLNDMADVVAWIEGLFPQGSWDGRFPEDPRDMGSLRLPPTQPQQPTPDSNDSSSSSSSGSSRARRRGPSSLPQPDAPPQQQEDQGPAKPAAVEPPPEPAHAWLTPAGRSAHQTLTNMGATVHYPKEPPATDAPADAAAAAAMDWQELAGYEEQKRAIEDCLLLPLQHPEVYDALRSKTRQKGKGSSRPRAVLFEGPPGTGKTTSAKILARQAAVPLVYVPLETLASKWYGESENNLAKVFKAAKGLGGAIIFLDELDALATSRDREMHEVSRRLLSVLLREIDGFDTSGQKAVLIGATNRRSDLDAALLSRFDMSINFGLPSEACRKQIVGQYAQQLSQADLEQLAAVTHGLSGRDLRDLCEQTERRWASRIIRGEVGDEDLPKLGDYLTSAKERQGAAQ